MKIHGFKLTIKGADFSKNAVGGNTFANYMTELKKHYTPTQEEEQALNTLFGVLSTYYDKFKLLYLFMGDNENSQSLNAVDPEKYNLEFINGAFEFTTRGLTLKQGIVIDSQYFPSKEELNRFTIIGRVIDTPYRGANQTYLGFRGNANANRFGLCRDVTGQGVGLYYVPSSGGAYNTSFVNLSEKRMKLGEWVATSVNVENDIKTASVYSSLNNLNGYAKHADISAWNINTNKSFNVFCESENNATSIDQGGWYGGIGQAVAFMDYLDENDIYTIGNAIAEFCKSRK